MRQNIRAAVLRFIELLEFVGLLEFLELMSLFTWIEVSDCRKTSIRFSRLLFQESIESPIGETFRVPGITILSCAITYLLFLVLIDFVEFTV